MPTEDIGARLIMEGERQFIAALESGQRAVQKLEDSIAKAEATTKKGASGFDAFKNSATEWMSKINLAKQALGMIEGALDKTIGATLRYSDQVRDLARVSGASAEESSRFIQVADDLQVSFDALKMSAKSAADQGITLTTESMVKLQAQYQAIKDPAEKADFAIKMFGRSGLEMQKILEMDTEAFLAMADGIDESLIMTDEQVKSARDLEIAMDDMGDAVQGAVYQFSKALIPVLTTAAGTVEHLTEMSSGYANILSMHEKDVRKSAKSYQDYAREMMRAKLVTEGVTNAEERAAAWVQEVGDGLEAYTVKLGFANKSSFIFSQNMVQLKETANGATTSLSDAAEATGPLALGEKSAADQAKDLAKALKDDAAKAADELKDRMANLTQAIAGPVGKAVRDYNEKQQDLNLTISTTAQRIQELNRQKFKTPEQVKELDDLKGKLKDAEKASIDLKTEFEDASRRMIFAMIQTKLASDGLTDAEVDNLIRIAEHWGLVDDATVETARQINALDLSGGRAELGSIDSILTHMNGLPRNYDYSITTTHTDIYYEQRGGNAPTENPPPGEQRHGGERFQHGGSFRLPDWVGYEGWQVGPGMTASGGERVIVLPKSMSAGPVTNNYSTANNYNLNVMTSQSPGVVQRSFAMMKMLAG